MILLIEIPLLFLVFSYLRNYLNKRIITIEEAREQQLQYSNLFFEADEKNGKVIAITVIDKIKILTLYTFFTSLDLFFFSDINILRASDRPAFIFLSFFLGICLYFLLDFLYILEKYLYFEYLRHKKQQEKLLILNREILEKKVYETEKRLKNLRENLDSIKRHNEQEGVKKILNYCEEN